MGKRTETRANVKALEWNPEKPFSINITDIWISRNAQISIGHQVKALCISYGMPYSYPRESLTQQVFWHEESGRLGMKIEVQDSCVESMYLEIPEGHWGFREKGKATQ